MLFYIYDVTVKQKKENALYITTHTYIHQYVCMYIHIYLHT